MYLETKLKPTISSGKILFGPKIKMDGIGNLFGELFSRKNLPNPGNFKMSFSYNHSRRYRGQPINFYQKLVRIEISKGLFDPWNTYEFMP